VVIIALFDLLKTTQSVLSNPNGWGSAGRLMSSLPSFTSWVASPCPTTAGSWKRTVIEEIDGDFPLAKRFS